VDEAVKFGIRAKAYRADVANVEQVDDMVASVLNDLGPVQILVNDAGITRDRSFIKMTRQMWDEVIAVNLGGSVQCDSRTAAINAGGWLGANREYLLHRWPVGQLRTGQLCGYQGRRHFVHDDLARELARKNITVNAVAPGFIATDMTKDLPDTVKATGGSEHTAGPLRRTRGGRCRGRVFGFARSELHHRASAWRERGNVHVEVAVIPGARGKLAGM
jgi:NAD(P)-dependent dehydrogenase (short-subunit alcohol dehydrogenase family)